jgi:hypothetical protein
MDIDPHCAGLYHGAALLEAKLGNIEGLAGLHLRCKTNFGAKSTEYSDEIISRLGAMELAARSNKELHDETDPLFGSVPNLRGYGLEDN